MKKINYPMPKKLSCPITKELEKKKQNKYKNKKVLIDGIWFDSQKEGNRYKELKLLEKTGTIHNLKLQVPFVLIPKHQINGKTIRETKYIADFVYTKIYKDQEHTSVEINEMIVEDTKGFRTKEYKLKKKMFEYKYKIEIEEV